MNTQICSLLFFVTLQFCAPAQALEPVKAPCRGAIRALGGWVGVHHPRAGEEYWRFVARISHELSDALDENWRFTGPMSPQTWRNLRGQINLSVQASVDERVVIVSLGNSISELDAARGVYLLADDGPPAPP